MEPGRVVADVDRGVFGSFVEHLGRCVYDGLYEPGHPCADADGFRTDVIALVRELGVSAIRYPGGNFVSGYRWEDGVGARESRPRRLDLAWHSLETNQVGLHEFAAWTCAVGSDLILALNLGTRGTLEALDLLEYANSGADSSRARDRAANGAPSPFGVRMWCLGNELDGPWQLGYRSAADYGKLAARTAKAMRQFDPSLLLVACGSSSRGMPTFGSWEREVLEHTWDEVDFISCHAYYEERDGDRASFLASSVDMAAFIDQVVATADAVAAARRSDKRMMIAFDEWNVWYSARFEQQEKITDPASWPVAPRLLEDQYSVVDAVVVGSLLITLLRHADRVKSANLAQLVNVIAPIMTEPGGPAWRQTIFYPFAISSRLARGQVLASRIESPAEPTAVHGEVPVLDAVVTRDPAGGELTVLLVHRGQGGPLPISVEVPGTGYRITESWTLSDADPDARNTLAEPDRVVPLANPTATVTGAVVSVELPPISWTALRLTP